ncbi:mucolipin-3 isoform X4 [Phycodurus eques]|uniref:mucolipin-3 isoform X4 n=1 Tax=Phycodurus eques TaxID=693459 RepID=UPI002ACD4488|nr:mucolipin-3 isoform X4 [Phycodurus eques]
MEESEPLLGSRSEERRPNSCCRWSLRTPNMDPRVVEDLRRRLKYFFMNPCQKYKARGRKPWKLMLQILKIVLITAQLVSFGLSNEMMVTFKEENLMTFRYLFLKGYKDHRQGGHVLHTKTDVYDHISYIIDRYINLQNLTVGNLAYERTDGEYTPLMVCQEFYRNSNIDPGNETFYIDPHIDTDCFSIYPVLSLDNGSLATPLNFSLDFRRLLSVNVYFTLKTINLQTVRHHELPDCYVFRVVVSSHRRHCRISNKMPPTRSLCFLRQIMFDNHAHSGNIQVAVENDVTINECRDWNVEGTSGKNDYLLLSFDSVVILACFASLVLCLRSVINGIQLQFQEFNTFFHAYYNKIVTMSDRMEFVNGWCILIIISDTLTIAGSTFKIGIQTKACYRFQPFLFHDELRRVQYLAGHCDHAGVGGRDSVPRFLQEIQYPDLDFESSLPKRDPILLLCSHDLPRLLFLWLDCARAIPRQIPNAGQGDRVPLLAGQWR